MNVFFGVLVCVQGHGSVVTPPPRQAIDRDLLPWRGPVPNPRPDVESKTGWCPVPSPIDGTVSGRNGQACFWFSNGCAVGCPHCDGTSRGPIPEHNASAPPTNPPTGIGRNKVGPNGVVCTPAEGNGIKPTMCDRNLRTVNVDAKCGGDDDWYYYSPWRAPGAAPVIDACGVAGGHRPPDGPFGGVYVNTSHAKLGDYGTVVLPAAPSQTSWVAGSAVEVSWTIEANHAGGYQYRLCPASAKLDEACFQKTPLRFVGLQGLRWDGGPTQPGGQEIFFNGTYVTEGTTPPSSQWVKNPIPILGCDAGLPGPCKVPAFEPRCTNTTMCTGFVDGDVTNSRMVLVDYVQIPKELPAGDYVLGWRWDCEQSNQIWQSCSDVTITK